MSRYVRPWAASLLAVFAAGAIAACGGSNSSSSAANSSSAAPAATGSGSGTSTGASTGTSGGKSGGTITIDSGTPPLSADPGLDFTTQGNELESVIDTPLLTFKRGVEGAAGSTIIPALATGLPEASNGGKTYTFTLRPNLHYSDGSAIKASDVITAVERDLKIPWQAASFISGYVKGADAYAKGKAKTISGLKADDTKGTLTVNLVAPFSPIVDIFALPGTAPVPPSTPAKNLASKGTIGDGPYMWSSINPEHQYVLVQNPKFDVPGLPKGHAAKIIYNVNSNVLANAEQVLDNQADVFDPGDTLPPSILQKIKSSATDRYKTVPLNSSWYFWFGVEKAPFNNIYAREAVLAATDMRALSRLDSGFMTPDCHLIPFGIPGHSSPSSCPFHNPNGPPNMTLAKSLMKKSGMIGQPVTIYGEERSPRRQYLDYFAGVLNSLGFKATEKVVNSGVYFTTIGAPTLKPQMGFGDWNQDFPEPWDFMQLFAGNAGSSLNYGYVNDPHFNQQIASLSQKATPGVASQWAALDQYAVNHAYYAAYGHEAKVKFYSNKLDFNAGVMSVEYLTDLTSLQLK
ncbi:MAG TPA: ABC transporter substrate-binding protein [Solirubrobacteraceae bacterium]|nr:ABC transporter substrate-binding protein [Solirubrobacteraceae bacterium]